MLLRTLIASALVLVTSTAASAGTAALFWLSEVEDVEVHWTTYDLAFNNARTEKPIYSFRDRFEAAPYSSTGCEHEGTVKLLSLVGPIASVHESDGGYCQGAAHPFAIQSFRAFDLRKQAKPAHLTDWFSKADIYKALMGDRVIQKALKSQGDARPRTLDALLTALDGYQSDDCAYGIHSDLMERFAFHHVKGNQVAVRLGLSHGCEANRGGLTQLGLYLPIPASLKAPLARAARGQGGYMMNKMPNGETGFVAGKN